MICSFPNRNTLISYMEQCGASYWPDNQVLVRSLKVPVADWPSIPSLSYVEVTLPTWAADVGVASKLLVPAHCIMPGSAQADSVGESVDWWQAAFLMLSCWEEAQWEDRHGPAHSYSYRLNGIDRRVWERAWVNRIFLFLRRWAARTARRDERDLFGPLPRPKVIVTHDVDAIVKTAAIRAKALAFDLFNGLRNLRRGDSTLACRKFAEGVRFFLSAADYWCFPRIRDLERRFGISSNFYIYAGSGSWSQVVTRVVFDPSYRVDKHSRLADELKQLHRDGCGIGLHQSFLAWRDAGQMRDERQRLETAIGVPVAACRQHWLRFSIHETWRAQEEAGLTEDFTLGFNDRPGFRGAAALRIRPWSFRQQRPHTLNSVPLVLMDSQVYDYQMLDKESRHQTIAKWAREIKDVGGTASVLWHQQVFSTDYAWEDGFLELLELIR